VTVESLLVFLIVGAIAGWLAGVIVKGHGFGLVGNIVVGIIGAFIAGWLLPGLGLGLTGIVGSIVYALIGAVILWSSSVSSNAPHSARLRRILNANGPGIPGPFFCAGFAPACSQIP